MLLSALTSHSHHPAAHVAAADVYRVHAGDTLSSIAKQEYGSARLWPALWWVNRQRISDPDVIRVGWNLTLSSWHPDRAWLTAKATSAAGRHSAPYRGHHRSGRVWGVTYGYPYHCGDGDGDGWDRPCHHYTARHAAPAPAPQPSTPVVSGSYEACVIARESGGNAAAVNSSTGAAGLYGFLPSTWHALGYSGLPQDASPATQHEAFQREYAQVGTSAWSPYDGC
jgi:resuscitation-promoting factor RpfC